MCQMQGFPENNYSASLYRTLCSQGRGWQDRGGVRKRAQRQVQLPLRGRGREEPDRGTGLVKGHVPKAAAPQREEQEWKQGKSRVQGRRQACPRLRLGMRRGPLRTKA